MASSAAVSQEASPCPNTTGTFLKITDCELRERLRPGHGETDYDGFEKVERIEENALWKKGILRLQGQE